MRNAGRLKLGYFPLPIEEGRRLRRLIHCAHPFSVLDPCVGTGEALQLITADIHCKRYGIELDAQRALVSSQAGIETVQGKVFDAHAKAETFSLLYLNPPYYSEIGSLNNQRMELLFLEHTYLRSTAKIQTHVRLQVDRYMGEEAEGHLLSIYGGDAEAGAIAAAVHEKHLFTLNFPDGKSQTVSMGVDASCYRGSLAVPGRKQPLRHLLAVSQALHANGAAGKTYLLNYESSLAWSTLVSSLGLPADPRWSGWLLDWLERENKVLPVQGIGCEPVAIAATRDELLQAIAKGLQEGALSFPKDNGPVLWPAFRMRDALDGVPALF